MHTLILMSLGLHYNSFVAQLNIMITQNFRPNEFFFYMTHAMSLHMTIKDSMFLCAFDIISISTFCFIDFQCLPMIQFAS